MKKLSRLLLIACCLQACEASPNNNATPSNPSPEAEVSASPSDTPTRVVIKQPIELAPSAPTPSAAASAAPEEPVAQTLRIKLEAPRQTKLEMTSKVDASFLYYGVSSSKQYVIETDARYGLDWRPEQNNYRLVSQTQAFKQVIQRVTNGQLDVTRLDNGQAENSTTGPVVSLGNLNLPPEDMRLEGVVRDNGEMDSYGDMRALWTLLLDYAEPSLQTQLKSTSAFESLFIRNAENTAKNHFQSFLGVYPSQSEVSDEESWSARANLTESLLGNSLGTITRTATPTWRLKEITDQAITLQYRGSLKVRSPQNGEVFDLDERGSAILDPDSGLLKELSLSLELESQRNTPQVPVTISLRHN
ncbi:MAG: hypothetical protein ACO1RX_00920 [Candidatus Sericytochromatia bacterium]